MLGFDPRIGVVIGMALALSSTAFALQPLTERGGLEHARRTGDVRGAAVPGSRGDPDARVAALFGTAAGVTSFSWHGLGLGGARDRGDARSAATTSRGRCSGTSRARGCARSSPSSRCCS
jgi:hypothetical protein